MESGQVLDLVNELVLGNITVDAASGGLPAGTLNLEGDVLIENGALDNAGLVNVTGVSNEIENENSGTKIFTNAGTLTVLAAVR